MSEAQDRRVAAVTPRLHHLVYAAPDFDRGVDYVELLLRIGTGATAALIATIDGPKGRVELR